MGLLDWAMPISEGLSTAINGFMSHSANRQNLALQKQEWAREDSSYQRKVADLKAAGLNPALALGGGSPSSLAVRVAAPQLEAPDMTAPIRMNLARQQAAITQADADVHKAEADYWVKYWRSRFNNAESDATFDSDAKQFESRLKAAGLDKIFAETVGVGLSNQIKDFGYRLEQQLGAPGSAGQIIRAVLGGSGGMLDLIRTLK